MFSFLSTSADHCVFTLKSPLFLFSTWWGNFMGFQPICMQWRKRCGKKNWPKRPNPVAPKWSVAQKRLGSRGKGGRNHLGLSTVPKKHAPTKVSGSYPGGFFLSLIKGFIGLFWRGWIFLRYLSFCVIWNVWWNIGFAKLVQRIR